jgi:hypothetical protein
MLARGPQGIGSLNNLFLEIGAISPGRRIVNENPNVASDRLGGVVDRPYPPCSPPVFRYFPPAVAKVYIVSFRQQRRPQAVQIHRFG